jgi:hypothetical protein
VILPVTWFHYPAAMLPFALAGLLRSRGTAYATRVAGLGIAALIVSIVAIAVLPLIWVAVGLVIAVASQSSQRGDGADG